MKRSAKINLVLLGSASMMALMLAGCNDDDEKVDMVNFNNPAECSAVYDATSCDLAWDQAKKSHQDTAPKYSSMQACESIHGGCQQTTSGGPWIPLIAGYMVGRMMNTPAVPTYFGEQVKDCPSGYRTDNGDCRTRRVYSGSTYIGQSSYAGRGYGTGPIAPIGSSNLAMTNSQINTAKGGNVASFRSSPSFAGGSASSVSGGSSVSSARGGFGGSAVASSSS